MVVVAMMTGSAAHRHELDEGVEGGVVLETSLNDQLVHVALTLALVRHGVADGGECESWDR